MKTWRKSIAPALLLAILVAATALAAGDLRRYGGLRSPPPKAVIFYAFTLLLYGWPEYLALAGAHYWLLQRYAGLRAPGYAAVLGAGLALAIWNLAVVFNLMPAPNSTADTGFMMTVFGSAGAVYGFGSAFLYRHYQLPPIGAPASQG